MSANNPYRTFVDGFVRVLTEGGAIGSRGTRPAHSAAGGDGSTHRVDLCATPG